MVFDCTSTMYVENSRAFDLAFKKGHIHEYTQCRKSSSVLIEFRSVESYLCSRYAKHTEHERPLAIYAYGSKYAK